MFALLSVLREEQFLVFDEIHGSFFRKEDNGSTNDHLIPNEHHHSYSWTESNISEVATLASLAMVQEKDLENG